jgi:hypothetical protein
MYAGILGTLALATSLVDGLVHARDPNAILFASWVSLLVFCTLGCVAGGIAGRMVQESVGAAISAELAQHPSIGARSTSTEASQPDNR